MSSTKKYFLCLFTKFFFSAYDSFAFLRLSIADRDFCKEQGLYNDDDIIYTKEVMDKLVYLREDVDVDMLCNMSEPLLESTVREIAELYNKGEEMEANKLERIKKELGFDIVKLADDIKVLSVEDIEELDS